MDSKIAENHDGVSSETNIATLERNMDHIPAKETMDASSVSIPNGSIGGRTRKISTSSLNNGSIGGRTRKISASSLNSLSGIKYLFAENLSTKMLDQFNTSSLERNSNNFNSDISSKIGIGRPRSISGSVNINNVSHTDLNFSHKRDSSKELLNADFDTSSIGSNTQSQNSCSVCPETNGFDNSPKGLRDRTISGSSFTSDISENSCDSLKGDKSPDRNSDLSTSRDMTEDSLADDDEDVNVTTDTETDIEDLRNRIMENMENESSLPIKKFQSKLGSDKQENFGSGKRRFSKSDVIQSIIIVDDDDPSATKVGKLERSYSTADPDELRRRFSLFYLGEIHNRPPRAKDHMMFACLVFACCNPVFGILAFVFGLAVNKNYEEGNYRRSMLFSKLAFWMSIAGIIVTLFLTIILLTVYWPDTPHIKQKSGILSDHVIQDV